MERKAVRIHEPSGDICLHSAFFCVYFICFPDLTEKSSQQNLRESIERISESAGDRSIRNVFLFCDPDDAGTEMFFPEEFQMSDTWAQDGLQEVDDFIEAQGIYIRQ